MSDINILINATNKASGPLKQVAGDVDDLGKRASNAAKGGLSALSNALGTALKVGAAAGVVGLGALGAAVIGTGVNFNNLKQQANIAFTTMLGDGKKAKVFLDELQAFAAKTPFEFPELLQASQRLLAMGFAAEDVTPTLTAIGDAVAALGGSGELVGRVTTALGQMQAKGKASAEEMGQLTEAGIPGWKFLAEAIGTDVAGAMEQVTKGAVDADTVISALVKGMNEDFGGMMEKQSQTFGGMLSTIKDTFTQVSGTVMGPLFDMLTEGLAGIVQWTSSPEFIRGVEDFASGLKSILEIGRLLVTGDFRGGIFGMFEDDEFIGNLFEVREAFIEFGNQIKGTFNTVQGTIITTMGWIRLAWEADWGEIRSIWTEFATDMPQLQAEFWREWKETFNLGSKQNVNDWEDTFGGLATFLTSWWRLTVTNWTLSLELLQGEFKLWGSVFQGDWEGAWEGFKQTVFAATDIVLNYVEFVFGPGFRDAFAGALNGIWDTLSAWWEQLKGFWNSTIGTIPGMGQLSGTINLVPSGAGSTTNNNNSSSSYTINQSFSGPYDPGAVHNESIRLLEELRRRGE